MGERRAGSPCPSWGRRFRGPPVLGGRGLSPRGSVGPVLRKDEGFPAVPHRDRGAPLRGCAGPVCLPWLLAPLACRLLV